MARGRDDERAYQRNMSPIIVKARPLIGGSRINADQRGFKTGNASLCRSVLIRVNPRRRNANSSCVALEEKPNLIGLGQRGPRTGQKEAWRPESRTTPDGRPHPAPRSNQNSEN